MSQLADVSTELSEITTLVEESLRRYQTLAALGLVRSQPPGLVTEALLKVQRALATVSER